MQDFKNKVAVVTGSTHGIGKAIALAFARAGANVVVCGRNLKNAQNAANDIKKGCKGRCIAFKCDVSDSRDVKKMIDAVVAEFGKIDILVNNAGVADNGSLTELAEESWDRTIDVDLKGVFLCSPAVAKHMIKRKYGKIVNIASVVGQMGNAGQANYAASKAGLIGLTKTLAREFAARNVQVNAVAPGAIEWPQSQSDFSPAERAAIIDHTLLKRVGSPADIARTVKFLVFDAPYVTGQVINVDGGRTAHL